MIKNDLKSDLNRIQHMVDAIEESQSFIHGKKKPDLDEDRMLVLSLIKEIEMIGEAANRVSFVFKEKHSEIPWDLMVRTRNRLIHGYYDINLNIIWETVKNSLPQIKNKLKDILQAYKK